MKGMVAVNRPGGAETRVFGKFSRRQNSRSLGGDRYDTGK